MIISVPKPRADATSWQVRHSKNRVYLRAATVEDIPAVTETLHRAFYNYPYENYTLQNLEPPDRKKAHIEMSRIFAEGGIMTGHSLVSDDCAGVALWWYDEPTMDMEGLAKAQGEYGPAFLEIEEGLKNAWITEEPFARLGFLAVHPDHQGKGLGKAIFAEALRQIGEHGGGKLPIHLHTSLDKNVAIYRKFGFEVVAEYEVPDADLVFWIMVRPAACI